jgi:hypothetical protein
MADFLDEISTPELRKIARWLARHGYTKRHLDVLMQDPTACASILRSLEALGGMTEQKSPYEMSPEFQIQQLVAASAQHGWQISQAAFERLAITAPPWPTGRFAVRSFRIRFGQGAWGVAKTFDAHVRRIEDVFAKEHFWCSPDLVAALKKKDRLHLHVGNDTHAPALEWVIIDLDTYRNRSNVTSVRGPESLADEGLVLAWLFPALIQAIDYERVPGLLLAGYELDISKNGKDDHRVREWVPSIRFRRDRLQASFTCDHLHDRSSYSSVPSLRASYTATRRSA